MLTINGVTVQCSEFKELEPERVGSSGRAYDGAFYSQVRAVKRVWTATTDYLTATELAALRTAAATDAPVTVVNTLDSVTMSASVRVNEVTDWTASASGVLRRAAILMREA